MHTCTVVLAVAKEVEEVVGYAEGEHKFKAKDSSSKLMFTLVEVEAIFLKLLRWEDLIIGYARSNTQTQQILSSDSEAKVVIITHLVAWKEKLQIPDLRHEEVYWPLMV